MLSKDPIRIAGPLGRIYSFTRHYQGDDFFEGPRLAFHHDRAYARDHLLRLTRSVVDDPFNYRLLDVWQLVFQKPWTRPRNVWELVTDLTDKIHRGELFVYLEPNLERDTPSLVKDGPGEGDTAFVDIGGLASSDTPRTQAAIVETGKGEPQDAPLTHAVPQGEPAALKSGLDRRELHRTVGLDTVVASGSGGETLGAMYDKVYDLEGNQRPGVDIDTARAFDEAYLQAQDIRGMRAAGYKMAVEDIALSAVLGPGLAVPSRLRSLKRGTQQWDNAVSRVDGDFGYLPPLRQSYVGEVYGLKKSVADRLASGAAPESVARYAYEARTELKIKYREHTPPDLLKTIDKRNIEKYGNKLGPTFDDLVRKGKSFEQIIESATRTGGGDLF